MGFPRESSNLSGVVISFSFIFCGKLHPASGPARLRTTAAKEGEKRRGRNGSQRGEKKERTPAYGSGGDWSRE
jgi:hypothetical protein